MGTINIDAVDELFLGLKTATKSANIALYRCKITSNLFVSDFANKIKIRALMYAKGNESL